MKRLLFLPLLALAGFSLTGCFEDDSRLYDGPMQAEFKPATVAGPGGSLYARSLTNPTAAAGARRDSVVVQLITAKQHTAAVTVNYAIDATSTALATTDYVLTSPAGTVTFEPGVYAVPVYFNTVPDVNAATTGTRTIIFNLMDTGDVKAAVNYKTFTVSIAR